ncbi:MAG TPA: cupin domain-containing protein [Patescibacteria group bacterium]|nr:cupin domain-containing protein [Patescibacteria group bacterium]
MISKIKLGEKIKEINGRTWYPVEVARVNNQVVRLALMKGEYHWHEHKNEDELFYVVEGELIIQVENESDISLSEGEFTVIPKGKRHCPKSLDGAYVLMFEPFILESKEN